MAGRRANKGDPLTDIAALAAHVPNWRALLRHGVDAGGVDTAGAEVLDAIEARLRTGRLLGSEEWIADQEDALGRMLAPARRGRKAGKGKEQINIASLKKRHLSPVSP